MSKQEEIPFDALAKTNKKDKRVRNKPAVISKEDLSKSLSESLPALAILSNNISTTVELIRKANAFDVSLATLEEIKKCLSLLNKSDPKKELKSIQKKMLARLKSKTRELES